MSDVLEPLLKNLVYVKFDFEVKSTLDKCNFVDKKLWAKYCAFQSEFRERIILLRAENRESPVQENADKNMPKILHTWTGKSTDSQPTANYHIGLSCAFDKARIDDYERRNGKFAKSAELTGTQAAKESSHYLSTTLHT